MNNDEDVPTAKDKFSIAGIKNQADEYMSECERLGTAVESFVVVMKKKLHEKVIAGYRGWDNPESIEDITDRMLTKATQLAEGDYRQAVDVANLSMMLHFLKIERQAVRSRAGPGQAL